MENKISEKLKKLIDAGIELHNIVDKEDRLIGYEWACDNWRVALSEFEKETNKLVIL
jgi:hypothetical protein